MGNLKLFVLHCPVLLVMYLQLERLVVLLAIEVSVDATDVSKFFPPSTLEIILTIQDSIKPIGSLVLMQCTFGMLKSKKLLKQKRKGKL